MKSISTTTHGIMVQFNTIILFVLLLVNPSSSVIVRPRRCRGAAKHIHLAVGKDPTTQMTISFATMWSSPEVVPPLGAIHYGTTPDNLTHFIAEQEYPLYYNTSHSNAAWGMYYSPFQHHITISDLEPDTTYYYAIVIGSRINGIDKLKERPLPDPSSRDDATKVKENTVAENRIHSEQELNDEEEDSERRRHRQLAPPPYDGSERPCIETQKIRSFRTAPKDSQSPLVFAIVGDIGQFEHSQESLVDMATHKDSIDAVMLVGDIAYTQNDQRRWDTFFDFLDDYSFFDEIPLQIATGNHDIDKQDDRGEIFQAYETRFRMPRVHEPDLGIYQGPVTVLNPHKPPYPLPYEFGNAYYSFQFGLAKHIVISAYSAMEPGSVQYNWLVDELSSIDREVTPWVLATIHVPMYNTFSIHLDDTQMSVAKQHIEPLLVLYRVNMVFTGHIHAYQRTTNVALDKLDETGPIHVTIGAGGRQCEAPFKNETAEEWIVTRDASYYGYGLFTVYNETHAEWRWVPLSPSEKQSYNYVKHQADNALPSLEHDTVVVENQFYR